MTEQEQITLYSCHLCGFCETSLSALTKHTASHIKQERNNEHARNHPSTPRRSIETNSTDVQLIERQDDQHLSASTTSSAANTDRSSAGSQSRNGNSRDMRQRQNGDPDREGCEIDDDDVIVLHDNRKSPQVGDVFPASSNPVTTQSRVMFPSGWTEPSQRTPSMRMSNDRYSNVQQTKLVSAQELNEHGQHLPKIINCTTVRSGNMSCDYSTTRDSSYYNRAGYEAVRSDSFGYSPPSNDRNVTFYRNDAAIDVEGDDSSKTSRSINQQSGRFQNDYISITTRSSPSAQGVHNRASYPRSRDVDIYENNERSQYYHNQRVRPMMQTTSSAHPHPSAFVSFNNQSNASFQQMNNARYRNDPQQSVSYARVNRPPYSSHNSRHGSQTQNLPHEPVDSSFRLNSYNQVACPVPLPNNANFIMNHNQQIVLSPYGSSDCVSGVLVIPIKRTCEVSIQTDESCMSNDNRPYHSVKSRLSSIGVQFDGQQDVTANQAAMQSNKTSSQLATCSVCKKDFVDATQLRSHFESSHSNESLKCKDCGQVFQTAKNMQMHKARVHNKRMPFRCGVCGLRFEDRSSVVQHLATHNANEKRAKCETCGKTFRNEERLKQHSLKHKEMWHKCTDCGKSFGSVATLDYHTEQVHKRRRDTNTAETRTRAVNENVHSLSGQQKTTFEVSDSSNEEEEAQGERSSISVGNEHGAFPCSNCSLTFKNSDELESHATICDKSSTNDRLSKMFRCIVCQTFFATKSQLTNHNNSTHLTRDGYICSKCPRKFRLWSKLKLHIKAFHPLKRIPILKFPCTACTVRFSTREKLNEHMKKTHQMPVKHERIYTCKECKKRFKNLSSLMVHRRGVHELNILESPSTQTWECPCCNIERLTRKTYIAHLKEVHNLLVAEKGRSLEIIGKDSNYDGQETIRSERSFSNNSNQRSANNQSAKEGTNESSPLKPQDSQKFTCQECGANFSEDKRLKNHLGLVHGHKPFSCGLCNRKFAYSGQIVWHMRDHGRKEARKKRLREMTGVVSHESVEVNNPELTKQTKPASDTHACVHCGTSFPDEKRLNNHLGVRHGYKNFQCDICSQKFSYSTHLIWHRRSHFSERKKEQNARMHESDGINADTDQANASCIEENRTDEITDVNSSSKGCESNSATYEYNDPGTQSDRQMIPESEQDSSLRGHRYTCDKCHAEFDDQRLFTNHCLKFHNTVVDNADHQGNRVERSPVSESRVFTCEICNKQLSTYIGWKVHRTRVHRVSGDDSSGSIASSDIANNTMNGLSHSDQDVSFHDSELVELGSEDLNSSTIYSCSKCSQIFTGLRNLRAHQFKVHSIESKDKGTRSSTSVISEPGESSLFAKVQDGEIFQCGTCDYQFSSEKGRRIHCKKMAHSEYKESPSYKNDVNMQSDSNTNTSSGITSMDLDDMDVERSAAKRQRLEEDCDDVISPCEVCLMEFGSLQELRSHLEDKHPSEILYETPSKYSGSSSTEEQANKEVTSSPSSSHSDVYGCPRCERSFPSRKGLNTHVVKIHRLKGAAFVKWVKGDRQGADPSSKSQNRNQSSNDGNDAAVASLTNNAGSLQKDNAYKPDSLTVSGRGFTPTMVGLDVNDSQPTPEVRRVCSICQRSFHNRRGLIMHMARFHHLSKSELRRFSFDLDVIAGTELSSPTTNEAGKSTTVFLKPSDPGEDCPLCDLKFPNRRSLGTHIFKRHGIRCKRLSPAERRALFSNRKHKLPSDDQDSGEKSKLVAIECPICPGKFVGKRGVRAHVSRIHGLDKIELGFLFPEKHQTDDAIEIACKHCKRDFTNSRIFAAHMYFVHKIDYEEVDSGKSVGLDASPSSYRCSEPKCEQTFNSALELLVHIREKYNRSINDACTDIKVTNDDSQLDQFTDYDYYEDEDGDSFEGDGDVIDGDDVVVMDSEAREDVNMKDSGVLSNSKNNEKEQATKTPTENEFACFLCKSEFKDEISFRLHYKKEHAGLNTDDEEELRDVIERSRLQSDAVSNEYGLRDTASRKAFRSEIVFTEECLMSPSSENDGEKPAAYPKDVSRIVCIEEEENGVAKQDAVGISQEDTPNISAAISANNEPYNDDRNDLDTSESNSQSKVGEEPSKKNFFAAALKLKVTP